MVVHTAAAGLVVGAVVAELTRPLASAVPTPADVSAWFDAAYLERAEAFRGPLRLAVVAGLGLRVAVPVAIACARPVRRRLTAIAATTRHPHLLAALAGGAIAATIDVVLLPLDAWAGWAHERSYGLSTQTLAGWGRDWLLVRGLGWLGVAAAVAAVTALARRAPRAWPSLLGLGGLAASAALTFASPLLLEPLLLRHRALPEGPVRDEVERVLAAAGEEVDTLLVAEASAKTTRENAHVSGLGGSRRVVLFDTLVQGNAPAEIGVVLAHELGHQRHGDVGRAVLSAGAGAVVGAWLLTLLARRRGWTIGPAAVPALVASAAVLATLGLPVQAWASRRAEAAADAYALAVTSAPDAYAAIMVELARANLGDPLPPRWVEVLASHPSTAARLERGRRWAAGLDRALPDEGSA